MTGGRKLARHDFCCRFLGSTARLTAAPFRGDHPAMAKFISRRRFTIEWGHCDPAGIVFNSRFFEFFDWGTWILFEAALGVKPSELAAAFGIAGLPLVDAGARFLAPARFDGWRRSGPTTPRANSISQISSRRARGRG